MNDVIQTPVNSRPHTLKVGEVVPLPPPELIQFVDPHGVPTPKAPARGLDLKLARGLLRHMTLARALDHEALALQRQGELSLWLQLWGQEAAQIGSIAALRPTDMVFPSYREHAIALYRGVSVPELLFQWRGVSHSGWDPSAYSLHINSLVLAAQTLHAAGYAHGVKLDGVHDEVVTVYVGDGATSEGDFAESLNWAAAHSLPLLFIVQNNQWAISTSVAKQMRTSIAQRAAGYGIAAWRVDGNDALAVHDVTSRAAQWARSGNGPALVEAETYRMAGHSSSDDPTRYRDAEEVEKWAARDPLARLEALLRATGTPAAFFDELADDAQAFRAEVRAQCRTIEDPDLADLFDVAYAEPHAAVAAERSAYLAHRASLAEVN